MSRNSKTLEETSVVRRFFDGKKLLTEHSMLLIRDNGERENLLLFSE